VPAATGSRRTPGRPGGGTSSYGVQADTRTTSKGPGGGASSYGVQADTRTTSKGPGDGASSYGVPLAARPHGCDEDPGVTWSEQTDDRDAAHVARESDKLLRARSEKVSSVTRHCASVNLKAESGVIK